MLKILKSKNVSFYLMGNDLVINNLSEVKIKDENNIVTLTGKQEFTLD